MDGVAAFTRWLGPVICILLLVIVAMIENGPINTSLGIGLSIVVMLFGIAWSIRGSGKFKSICELYLWLSFILAMYHLNILANGVAEWIGAERIDVFRVVAVTHVLIVMAALWVLGAWSKEAGLTDTYLARVAAGLFILGAVVFWVGARTFPGITLEQIDANRAGNIWTSVNFMLATIITLGGLTLFTITLKSSGDRFLSILGLFLFAFASVFWVVHLAFRMTVLVEAAQEWSQSSISPEWFEPWRVWARLLFAIYSVLAYIGLAAYGGAILKTGWLPRWIGWICIVAGFIAAPLGGLPLFIHIPLWLAGILVLRQGQLLHAS